MGATGRGGRNIPAPHGPPPGTRGYDRTQRDYDRNRRRDSYDGYDEQPSSRDREVSKQRTAGGSKDQPIQTLNIHICFFHLRQDDRRKPRPVDERDQEEEEQEQQEQR